MLACTDFTTSVLGPRADRILLSATQHAELTHPKPRFISTSFFQPRSLLITPCTMGRLRRVRKAKARLERLCVCVRACVQAYVHSTLAFDLVTHRELAHYNDRRSILYLIPLSIFYSFYLFFNPDVTTLMSILKNGP